MELHLGDPHPGWGPNASRARYGDRAVVAILGAPLDGAVAAARARSAAWIGREVSGVWPLLDVVDAGARPAWIYPAHDGISLGPLVDGDLPPFHVAAEVVGEIARVLHGLGEAALAHPGPLPEDVLLGVHGEVDVLGFVGPSVDTRRVPPGGEPSARLVYRLGLLFAELLCGSHPGDAETRSSHENQLRRVVIRVMARPGPALPERLRDWLQGMLAWDAGLRPPLARLAQGLLALARELDGQTLAEWATLEVAQRSRVALPRPIQRTTGPMPAIPRPSEPTRETVVEGLATLPGADEIPDNDDVTAISIGSEPRYDAPPELGTIPVMVGPPPEVARKRPSLPAEIFSDEGPPPAPTPPPPVRDGRGVLVGAAVVLCVIAAGLIAYLFGLGG